MRGRLQVAAIIAGMSNLWKPLKPTLPGATFIGCSV